MSRVILKPPFEVELLDISHERWKLIDPDGKKRDRFFDAIADLMDAIADKGHLQVHRDNLDWGITEIVEVSEKADKISTALNHFQGWTIDGPENVKTITEAILKHLRP